MIDAEIIESSSAGQAAFYKIRTSVSIYIWPVSAAESNRAGMVYMAKSAPVNQTFCSSGVWSVEKAKLNMKRFLIESGGFEHSSSICVGHRHRLFTVNMFSCVESSDCNRSMKMVMEADIYCVYVWLF